MKGFFRLLEGVILFGLAFAFIRWFVKGLFGKYFILFWVWLILSIVYYWAYHDPDIMFNHNWPQHDDMTGAEAWERNH
jgi:hypothetical protein